MKKIIIAIFLFNAYNFTHAQIIKGSEKLPMKPSVSSYLNEIKAKLTKPENSGIENVKFLIQVMSPGKDVVDTDQAYWFASYGETVLDVLRPNTISTQLSASNNVKYWFNDRIWDETGFRRQFESGCCINTNKSQEGTPGNPNLGYGCTLVGHNPFSTEGAENGHFTITSNKLNLFSEWNWQVKNTYQIGSILYGELDNGFTFSLSYRFMPNLRVH